MTLKTQVKQLIIENKFDEIIDLARKEQSRTVRYVQMNIFGWDDQIQRWQAIEALGKLAKELANENDEIYRNTIRRCLWAMNDESGNVPWAAPEVMAILIKAQPEKYDYFIKMMITNALDNPMCHKGMLWGIAYLGKEHNQEIGRFLDQLLFLLDAEDEQLRTHAVWAFLEQQYEPALAKINELKEDQGKALIYRFGALENVSIAQLIQEYKVD